MYVMVCVYIYIYMCMYVYLVYKSKHWSLRAFGNHRPGGTKSGSGASLFPWQEPEPSCREAGTRFQGKPLLTPQDSSVRSHGLSQAVGGRCVAVLEGQCVPLALSLPCVLPGDKELGLGSDQGQRGTGALTAPLPCVTSTSFCWGWAQLKQF